LLSSYFRSVASHHQSAEFYFLEMTALHLLAIGSQSPPEEQLRGLKRLEEDGRVTLKPGVSGPFSGVEIRRFGRKLLSGSSLAPVLAEPRIIYVPDERPPKAKWKVEFRRDWPDTQEALSTTLSERLLDGIRHSRLDITGLWVNPTVDFVKFATPDWANLMVSAMLVPRTGPEALLRFYRLGSDVWVAWDEK